MDGDKNLRGLDMETYLTVAEICGLLKVERCSVIRWIRSGKLRGFKLAGGRLWRVSRSDFQRFLKGGPDFQEKFISK